jgi:hypothetical protein
MRGQGNGVPDGAREGVLNGGSDEVLEGTGRPPNRARKKGAGMGELEAGELAARESMLDLLSEGGRNKLLRRRKVTSRSSQRAEKGSRSSGLHAAEPKAAMPQREGK